MESAAGTVPSVTKRTGRQKTIIAPPDIFALLAAAVDLLNHASPGDHREARLIRNAIRLSVADAAIAEADALLQARLATMQGREHAADVKRIRAEVAARVEVLKRAEAAALACFEPGEAEDAK